jgi:hypothetical protein
VLCERCSCEYRWISCEDVFSVFTNRLWVLLCAEYCWLCLWFFLYHEYMLLFIITTLQCECGMMFIISMNSTTQRVLV